jgi:hypothetical protein
MAPPPFPQNVVALILDFDKTLLPGYMQEPLFARYDGPTFWAEVNALPAFYRRRGQGPVSEDTIYLSHILTYVKTGKFAGLNNEVLRQLGGTLEFYPGLLELLPRLKSTIAERPRFAKHDTTVEHYVVSTGLRQMILGSGVAPHVDDIWACEFLELTAKPGFLDDQGDSADTDRVIQGIAYSIDNTTKTRAIFEINKGVNKHPEISVNDKVASENRRVPIENMIYVADGPSDVPVFSIINQYGGRTFAVYNPANEKEFRQVVGLQEQNRVQGLGPADYSAGGQTARWLTYWAEAIATSIADRHEEALGRSLGKSPRHIIEAPKAEEAPQDEVGKRIAEDRQAAAANRSERSASE